MVIEILGLSLMLKLLVTDLWTLLWNIKFTHPMGESSSLLILLTCSVLHVKSHLSHQHILNQLETAVLDLTHSMYQLEILGASLLLKLLVSDLWTLLWNIKFIHPMWKSSSLANFIIVFSVACEISPFTSTHTEPIRAAVLDSTHSMYQLEILGASLLLK